MDTIFYPFDHLDRLSQVPPNHVDCEPTRFGAFQLDAENERHAPFVPNDNFVRSSVLAVTRSRVSQNSRHATKKGFWRDMRRSCCTFCRGCGSILCVCGSLEIVRQFAGVPFRLSENAEQHLPRHQISIADLADESGVNFDLMPL